MSTTIVTRLAEADGRRLYEALGHGSFTFKPVPHAHWSARGEDATATWYRSGKLVVQGRGAEVFAGRYLPGVETGRASGGPASDDREVILAPTIGSDESGKGDYFGPLVVAAARVRPEDQETLLQLGVEDSKQATDARVRRVEGALADRLPHAVVSLEPEDYNRVYAEVGNLNVLLGRLHAQVIDEVLAQVGDGKSRIVVDRFGDPDLVRRALSEAARQCPFTMPTKGERNPAVAAASFLARAAFLRGMDELDGLAGGPLYRGASDPRIAQVARRLHREGGRAWLGRFAKLHFRVTEKALG